MRRRPNPNDKPTNEEGSAMVAALWLSLILALLSIAMITISRDTLLEVKTNENLEAAWLKAESGLSIAKYNIANRQNPWVPRDEPYKSEIEGEEIEIFVTSPKGKVDLNYASAGLLTSLLTALGYEPDRASKITDHILDWADADDLSRLNGAEKRDYDLTGTKTGPANRPFRHVSELQHVLELSYADYQCLAPFVTTFAQDGSLEPAYASRDLRSLLGLTVPQVSLETRYRRASLAAQVFEISADVDYSKHTKARVTEIIRYTGIPADPIWVHRQDQTLVPTTKPDAENTRNFCPNDISTTR